MITPTQMYLSGDTLSAVPVLNHLMQSTNCIHFWKGNKSNNQFLNYLPKCKQVTFIPKTNRKKSICDTFWSIIKKKVNYLTKK